MTSLRGHDRTEFPQSVRKAAFRRCCRNGMPHCEGCGNELRSGGVFYEHMDPDGLGGEPTLDNCQVRCRVCKQTKDKVDNPRMAKADAVLKSAYGLRPLRKKIQGAGFRKADPQRTASRPIERKGDRVTRQIFLTLLCIFALQAGCNYLTARLKPYAVGGPICLDGRCGG